MAKFLADVAAFVVVGPIVAVIMLARPINKRRGRRRVMRRRHRSKS